MLEDKFSTLTHRRPRLAGSYWWLGLNGSLLHTHTHTHTQFLPMQISDQLCFAPQNLKNSYLKKYVTIGIPFAESDISWLPA